MTIVATRLALITCLGVLAACSESTTALPGQSPTATDITDAIFGSRDAACSTYAGSFTSSVLDVGRNVGFMGVVQVAAGSGSCTIISNSIPNHDFNEGGMFATLVQEVGATTRCMAPTASAPTRTTRILSPTVPIIIMAIQRRCMTFRARPSQV